MLDRHGCFLLYRSMICRAMHLWTSGTEAASCEALSMLSCERDLQVEPAWLRGVLHHILRGDDLLDQHHHRRARSAARRAHPHCRVGHPVLVPSGEHPHPVWAQTCPFSHANDHACINPASLLHAAGHIFSASLTPSNNVGDKLSLRGTAVCWSTCEQALPEEGHGPRNAHGAGAGVLLLHHGSNPVHAGDTAKLVAHQALRPRLACWLLELDWRAWLLALVRCPLGFALHSTASAHHHGRA